MMKKTISLIAIIGSGLAFGQCNIIGNSTISVNQAETYKVDTQGQCAECYHWSAADFGIKLKNNKQQTISLKANEESSNTLRVSVMTNNGIVECSKTITTKNFNGGGTINANSNNENTHSEQVYVPSQPCEIDANDFTDLQIDETKVKFSPNGSQNFEYIWKVTYANGQTLESSEREPSFQIIKGNDIVLSQVKIQSNNCFKTLSRAYPLNFWAPPVNLRVPQKVYEQVEYSHYSKGN